MTGDGIDLVDVELVGGHLDGHRTQIPRVETEKGEVFAKVRVPVSARFVFDPVSMP